MNKLNVVIVGYGGMGSWHSAMIQNSKLNVYGAYDILVERLEVAKENGLLTYKTFDEVLQDENVDIVLIATPNDSHCEIALRAMNSKKHVICEKPVAMNLEELERMIKCSYDNNVKFTVNQNRRQDTDFLTAKKVYESRVIGDVFHIESKVIGSRGIPGDWRGMKKHGGGMLFDWGIHILDQLLQLTDEKIVSVYASFSHVTNEEVDDGFVVHCRYANGMTAHVEVGTTHFITPPRWYIAGNNGTAKIGMWDETGEIVVLNSWNDKDVKPIKAASGFTKTMAPRDNEYETTTIPVVFEKSDDYSIYNNFYDVITEGADLVVSHESILKTFRFITDIFESAHENKVIYYK